MELAALLHDLTKPYDGEYVLGSDGKRLVDEHGLWLNAPRPPARENAITRLYEALHLQGTLHCTSGAVLAEHLLADEGVDRDIIRRVAQTIAHHLSPPADAPVESRCLYDADTIDANIGLPALVRNLYINLHFHDQSRAPSEPPIAEILATDPLRYLRPYIRDSLPRWTLGKRDDFLAKLTTSSGRELALARLDRLDALLLQLRDELTTLTPLDHNRIGLFLRYMQHTDDPSIWDETERLSREWAADGASAESLDMLAALRKEMRGEQ